MLICSNSLYIRFIFTPLSRPSPPSPLRIEAYREGAHLFGPEIDPDGWEIFSGIELRGILFHSRPITVTVTVRGFYIFCSPVIDV